MLACGAEMLVVTAISITMLVPLAHAGRLVLLIMKFFNIALIRLLPLQASTRLLMICVTGVFPSAV